MTPSGIEPATFRFVAQYLNHCATISGSPIKLRYRQKNICRGPEGSRSLGLPDFQKLQLMKVVSLSALSTVRLHPLEIFLVLISVRC
jgi:hypothetical protein